jgi:hypothetical protein
MSRAFVNEDAPTGPPRRFALPPVDDPAYEAAAAYAMIEAARDGDTASAETATGYRWGAEPLLPHVERILEQEKALPEDERDQRLITVCRRFVRAASRGRP